MKRLSLLIIVGACALAPLARAQQPATPPNAEQQAIRQAIIAKIEAIKYQKMQSVLQLDDATANRFFNVYKPAEQDVQSLVKQRNDLMKQLAAATNSNSTNADVGAMAQQIRSLNEQISDREQKLDNDLKPILTPLQRAKLLVFEHQFEQRVREQIAAHRLQMQKMRDARREVRQQRIQKMLRRNGGNAKAIQAK